MADVEPTPFFDSLQVPLDDQPQRPNRCVSHVGHTFGRLRVLSQEMKNHNAWLECLCTCGNKWSGYAMTLLAGKTISCGCYNREKSRKDLTGQRFGQLVVLAMSWTNGKGRARCICDCGDAWEGLAVSLIHGMTRSCGCLSKQLRNRIGEQHGQLVVTTQWREGNRTLATATCLRCGGTWKGRMDLLTSGSITACGCLFAEIKLRNHRGEKHGTLTIFDQEYRGGLAIVQAICDCGNLWTGAAASLIHGRTQTCGCQMNRVLRTVEEKRAVMYLLGQRRRARVQGLPAIFTYEQHQFMLRYWQDACAICGREGNGLWHILAIEHWIPVASPHCLGTICTNILPLCHGKKGARAVPGPRCCNNEKSSKDPVAWLTTKLGPRKAKKKLVEIEAYFVAAQAFALSLERTAS